MVNAEVLDKNRDLPAVAGDRNVGEVSASSREEHEIKASIVCAKQFPRDEIASGSKIINSCQRLGFAEDALYSFPRGGRTISGPSVHMAREMARLWGNIRFGIRIVSDDEDRVHIKGYAFDSETNTLVEMEDKFKKLIFRKSGGWMKPDERDLRELINRRGAICVRNAILQLIPFDLVEDAIKQVDKTIRSGVESGDPEKQARAIVASFKQFGVTQEMIEERLGHETRLVTPEEISELRGIYKAIEDGASSRDDYFNTHTTKKKPESGSVSLDDLKSGGASEDTPEPEKKEKKGAKRKTAKKPSETQTNEDGSVNDELFG